jgi:hypothetical protein
MLGCLSRGGSPVPSLRHPIPWPARQILAALALGGCANSVVPSDGGAHDLRHADLAVKHDMAQGLVDMSAPDLAMAACTEVADWPALQAAAAYQPANDETVTISAQQAMEPQNILSVEDWHLGAMGGDAGENYPKVVPFSMSANYSSCDVCVRLFENCTKANGCDRGYFIQGGTVTVSRADRNPAMGRMTVSGQGLMMVEWMFPTDVDGGTVGDTPVAGGRCFLIDQLSLDVPWSNTTDGGVPDMPGPVADLSGADLVGVDLAPPPGDFATAPADLATATGGDGGPGCHVVVNELQTGTPTSASDEFVEIFNPCAAPINIGTWKLVYRSAGNNGGGADITLTTLAAGTTVAPGGFFLGVNNLVAGTRTHDFTYTGGLAGAGGAVGLRDPNGQLVDSVAYEKLTVPNNFTEGSPAGNPPAGQSLSRIPNGVDRDNNSLDFKVTMTPTPGAINM